jgi:hypothetical protein
MIDQFQRFVSGCENVDVGDAWDSPEDLLIRASRCDRSEDLRGLVT